MTTFTWNSQISAALWALLYVTLTLFNKHHHLTWSCHWPCHQRWRWPIVLQRPERMWDNEWDQSTLYEPPDDRWLYTAPDNCLHLHRALSYVTYVRWCSTHCRTEVENARQWMRSEHCMRASSQPLTVYSTRQLPAPTHSIVIWQVMLHTSQVRTYDNSDT